jgi:hypothetical protein
MSNNGSVWTDFMSSEYAQNELKKIEKKAQQWSVNMDRGPLYDKANPGNDTTLSQSVTTQGVSGGGGSMVGSEDRKPLYTTKSAPVPGGEETYADATVEGLEDVHSAMLEVAHKAPTGKPLGTQDNKPEKWEGIQAAGSKKAKQLLKKAQDMFDEADEVEEDEANEVEEDEEAKLPPEEAEESVEDMIDSEDHDNEDKVDISEVEGLFDSYDSYEDESEDESLESILAELESEDSHGGMPMMDKMGDEHPVTASTTRKTVAILQELVKIANDLDANRQHADASEIDAVLKEEVQTLIASAKRKRK